MNKITSALRYAFVLSLMFVISLLYPAGLAASADDGKAEKAGGPARKVELSDPQKTAVSAKKRPTKDPDCRQTATKKQVSGVAKKLKELQEKNGSPKPENPR